LILIYYILVLKYTSVYAKIRVSHEYISTTIPKPTKYVKKIKATAQPQRTPGKLPSEQKGMPVPLAKSHPTSNKAG